jgi:hypothetical protein
LLALACIGCGGVDGEAAVATSKWLAPNAGKEHASSGSPVERFFPLVDGMVYTYVTENELAEKGLLITRVYRGDATHGELRFASGSKRFELGPAGVQLQARDGSLAFVLRLPVAAGTAWRGEHGGQTKIVSVTEAIDTPAGHYDGCVRTLEERLGDAPVRYSTVFCPEVGVVELEASTGRNYERAVLKSYAPPLRMRDDGSDKLPVGTPDFPVQ